MAARKKSSSGRKYGKAASKSVKSAMHRKKAGTLKSGKGRHPKVKSREQAIAIGLSEAREKGAKVPRKRSTKKSTRKKSTRKKSSSRKKSTRKKSTRKRAA
jgi:hypothetical protein